MRIPTELKDVLKRDPQILNGCLCFKGTDVPVEKLLDYINTGDSLENFLAAYPKVSEDQALAVLAWQDKKVKRAMGIRVWT